MVHRIRGRIQNPFDRFDASDRVMRVVFICIVVGAFLFRYWIRGH